MVPYGIGGLKGRPRAIYYAIFMSLVLCLINTTKTIYHEARPFWATMDIIAYTCTTQFGNPSGHSVNSAASAVICYLDYHTACERNKIPEGSFWRSYWVRRILLFLVVVFPWTVGYGRVVMGAHSYNQIFYGFLCGIWLAFSYHYLFYDRLLNEHCKEICEDKVFR